MPNYLATSKDNKLFISVYETEEPNIENFRKKMNHSFSSVIFDMDEYKLAHKHWQSSKREYRVRESDVEELFEEIYETWGGEHCPDSLKDRTSFRKVLDAHSIDCTFLKNRLKLERIEGMGVSYAEDDEGVAVSWPMEWTLKPEVVKEENEAVEFAEWLRMNYSLSPPPNMGLKQSWVKKKDWALASINANQTYTTKELYQIFKNPNKQ